MRNKQQELVRRCKEAKTVVAQADWDCFASSLKKHFNKNASDDLFKACDCILTHPPQKQVVINGKLAWEPQSKAISESEVDFLLRMVRCVRNNLFHGGKHNAALHEDKNRTKRLLESSLVILEECLKLSPDVKRAFDDAEI